MKIILKEYTILCKTAIILKPFLLISWLMEMLISITIMCVITFNKVLIIEGVEVSQLLFQIPLAFFGLNFMIFFLDIISNSSFIKNELIIFSKNYEKRFHHFLIAKFLFYFSISFIQWFVLIIILLSTQKLNNYFIIIYYLVPTILIPLIFVAFNALIIKLDLLKKYKLTKYILLFLLIQGFMSIFTYYPNLFLYNKDVLEILNYFSPFFYIIYLQAKILSTIDFYIFIPLIYYFLFSSIFIMSLISKDKKKERKKWNIKL